MLNRCLDTYNVHKRKPDYREPQLLRSGRKYFVINMIIQSGTTEDSAFVIRKDSRGVFLWNRRYL